MARLENLLKIMRLHRDKVSETKSYELKSKIRFNCALLDYHCNLSLMILGLRTTERVTIRAEIYHQFLNLLEIALSNEFCKYYSQSRSNINFLFTNKLLLNDAIYFKESN